MDVEKSIERDGAKLISVNKQIVEFTCKCGTVHQKQKRAICQTSGAFCKFCSNKNTQIKRIRKKIEINNALLACS
jgi:hypothetical protein